MATQVYINGSDRVMINEPITIVGINELHPNTEFTVSVYRRLASAPRATATDFLVESISITSDASGFVNTVWSPGSNVQNYTGDLFRYYPVVSIPGEPDGFTDFDYDITVFDAEDFLLHELDVSLGPVQAIPVYTEISKDTAVSMGTAGRTSFDFTWDNWNGRFEPVVYTLTDGGETLHSAGSDFDIDYRNGKVIFYTPIPYYVDVEASYVFKYFSDAELRDFLNLALWDMNFTAPATEFNLRNYPSYWRSVIVSGGIIRAIEQLHLATIFRERRLIFSDVDIINSLASYYERVKASFGEALTKKARWSLVSPRAMSGHDILAPPRVTAQSYQSWAYLRGRGI